MHTPRDRGSVSVGCLCLPASEFINADFREDGAGTQGAPSWFSRPPHFVCKEATGPLTCPGAPSVRLAGRRWEGARVSSFRWGLLPSRWLGHSECLRVLPWGSSPERADRPQQDCHKHSPVTHSMVTCLGSRPSSLVPARKPVCRESDMQDMGLLHGQTLTPAPTPTGPEGWRLISPWHFRQSYALPDGSHRMPAPLPVSCGAPWDAPLSPWGG